MIGLTVDRLVDAVAPALAVGDSAQTSAGAETDAAGDDAGLVADNVAEEVAGDDDAVEAGGVLDHDHGGAVDELVVELELGKLLGHGLGDNLAPQAARGENVGLVQAPHGGGRVPRKGEVTRQAGDALDLGTGVGLGVHGVTGAVILGALAKVDAAGQLADDGEVGAAAHLGLEGRELDEGVGGEEGRSQVAVRAHLLAQLEETLLRADGAGAPFGTTDGTEDDGIGSFGGGESLVGQRDAVGVDGALLQEVRSPMSEIVSYPSTNQRKLSTYATEKVLLKVELGGAIGLDDLENL